MSGLRFDVLTLFPAAFTGPMDESILGRARAAGHFDLQLHDIRDHAPGPHRTVDDYPFGGGQGMLLRVDVLDRALRHVQALDGRRGKVVYLSPAGRRLTDGLVRELAVEPRLILVCGRYEGVDERFIEHCVDLEVSIGDYVLTGGELPAMVLIDAVARHVHGVLGDDVSPEEESFVDGLLEHPQYTRPASYEGWDVPPILLGGDHARIEEWRRQQRIARTAARRPDLLPLTVAASESVRRKVGIPGVRVRPFRYPDDLPEVLAIWRKAGPGIVLRRSDEPPELAKKLGHHPELFMVAEQAHRIVGAVLGGWDGRRGYVSHLAVVEEHRSRGIAAALLRELEERLRTLGCLRMNLTVAAGNIAGEAFFRSQGWQPADVSVWAKDLEPA